jgi:hypothetical protein
MLGHDHVPGLFATEYKSAREHRLHHVLVADGRAQQLQSMLGQRDFEANVAHHGRDDGVPGQLAAPVQVERQDQEHGIAIDDAAAMVDEDGPIAVSIKRNTELTRVGRHRRGQHRGVRRSAREIDVAPIRFVAEGNRDEPQRLEQRHRGRGRRAVGHIHGDPGARQRPDRRQQLSEVREIRLDHVGRLDLRGGARIDGPARVGHQRLDAALLLLAELLACSGEDFDAVVAIGVMRCRQHDAEIEALGVRQIRHTRRRHDAGARHVCAFGHGAAREFARDPLARLTRVASEQHAHGPVHPGRVRPHDGGAQA